MLYIFEMSFKCAFFDVLNGPIKHFWVFVFRDPKKSKKVENHHIFYIYIELTYLLVKFVKKKSGGNDISVALICLMKRVEKIVIVDFFLIFLGSKRQKIENAWWDCLIRQKMRI